jgi:hypothetical protein
MPESNRPDYSRYPEVAAAGDLRTALQETFDTAGMPLTAQYVESPGWVATHAVVRAADRQVYVHMRSGDRAFAVDLGIPGFQMAHGLTADLRNAAGAISTFLNGATLRQLGAAWPFVTFSPFAEAFERGEADAIAYRWQQLLDPASVRARQRRDLHDFLVAASGEPRLCASTPEPTPHQRPSLGTTRRRPVTRAPAVTTATRPSAGQRHERTFCEWSCTGTEIGSVGCRIGVATAGNGALLLPKRYLITNLQ